MIRHLKLVIGIAVFLVSLYVISVVGRKLFGPTPKSEPSRDSISEMATRAMLEEQIRASAQRDSIRNAAWDSLQYVVTGFRLKIRTLEGRIQRTGPKPGTASDSTAYWQERALEDERLIGITIRGDSILLVASDSLYQGQRHESDSLRALLSLVGDSLKVAADSNGSLRRQLFKALGRVERQSRGTHLSFVVGGEIAGGCWTALAGPELAKRGKFLFITGEMSVAGGLGLGGCGRIPTNRNQVQLGPSLRVTALKIGFP